MALQIRNATPDDAPVILEFIRGLAEYEREPDAVKLTLAQLRAQMASADPPFECILAEEHGRALGFALFFRVYSTWLGQPLLYLEDLFVLEESRGRGVGATLLRRLAQIAVERGWRRMQWSVLDWNASAHAFYRALGARPDERWTTWLLEGRELEGLAKVGR